MPEGPEVETIRIGLQPVIGHKIVAVNVADEPKYFKGNEEKILSLKGKTITSIERRGKFLIWDFGGLSAINHLGMSGIWHFSSSDDFNLQEYKHYKVCFTLVDKTRLLFTCVRKFGKFIVMPRKEIFSLPTITNLGPDILEVPFDAIQFKYNISQRKIEIGKALLNPKIIAGCGNIYKNEALFRAKIHPTRSCKSLNLEEIARLASSLSIVAQRALKMKGSTLKDFRLVDGYSGLMQNEFKVYGRVDEPCINCESIIKVMRQGDRSSFYCPSCQSYKI